MKKIFSAMSIVFVVCMLMSTVSVFAASDSGWNWGDWNIPGWDDDSSSNDVAFYIAIAGKQLDSNGNVQGQDTKNFTDALGTTTLNQSLSSDFSIATGNGVTEADILSYLTAVPKTDDMFKKVVEKYESMDAYICSSNGKVIPWSRLTSANYKPQWYVLKNESDGWHVDGVIIDLETDDEISIVIPDEDAERAACVEYDVVKGTFAPGFMKVKENRPHSVWQGNNEKLIIEGFDDVWYTVLDEETFEENSCVIPQDLIDAATAVEKLGSARLSELPKTLQRQYGRIDSQAYKQEYIGRNGLGTLYVTPFITEMLSNRYGVDNDSYIWLAMGDADGNIVTVYVMDRNAAGLDNLFDEE